MRLNRSLKKQILLLISASLPLLLQAQGTQTKMPESANTLLGIVMLIIAFVLAFVIWGMSHVLITLGKQLLDKNKGAKNVLTIMLIPTLLLLSASGKAQTTAEAVVASAPNYGGMNSTGFWMLSTALIIEIIIIGFLMFFINRIQQELVPAKESKPMALATWWSRMDKKLFTRAVAVEKEADILLDHDYDGIKELDNALPPWWKYGFYITIGIAVVYLLHFHVLGSGKNPTEEYAYELTKAQADLDAYALKNENNIDEKIDEKNIVLAAQRGIDEGKELYNSVCWTCHGKMGEGGTGPNLTDDYWIHKGSLNDIYMSIKRGYPEKGMQAWDKNYTPKEMSYITSYIKTLKGTSPANPKPPQGDLYTEEISTPAKDSSNLSSDTTLKK